MVVLVQVPIASIHTFDFLSAYLVQKTQNACGTKNDDGDRISEKIFVSNNLTYI